MREALRVKYRSRDPVSYISYFAYFLMTTFHHFNWIPQCTFIFKTQKLEMEDLK